VRRLLAFAASGAVLAGCGGSAPRPSSTAVKLAQAQTTHEYPGPAPAPQTASGASTAAVAAVRSFATSYINWTADTVAADMRALAQQSVGQARAVVTLAATQTAGDYELKRGGIANSGIVEAIAPLAGHRDQYIVVTRESTTATNTTAYQGLRPAWHVALATVTQLAGDGWVLSGWQPES
jgi:hypothetical protein